MTNEYYGVASTPTSDFLAHYGVKGMKWGVRKAIERGNNRSIARHYRKAVKKLAQLNERADISAQEKKAKQYGKIRKVATGVAAVGGLTAIGGTGFGKHFSGLAKKTHLKHLLNQDRYREYESQLLNHHQNKFLKGITNLRKSGASEKTIDDFCEKTKKDFEEAFDKAFDTHNMTEKKLKDQFNSQVNTAKAGFSTAKVGSAVATVGLLGSAIAGSKAHAAKKRTTAEGHAKAVQERDAWKKEMQDAFKGTAYQNLPKVINKKRRKSK